MSAAGPVRRMLMVLATCGVLLSGCGDSDAERQERAEERATQARAFIDDLAGRIGTSPKVVQDELGDCVPGDASGIDLSYLVQVTVEPGAAARLRGEIADHLASEGWTVTRRGEDASDGTVHTSFAKGRFTMSANVDEAVGRAAVIGSGGCVR